VPQVDENSDIVSLLTYLLYDHIPSVFHMTSVDL